MQQASAEFVESFPQESSLHIVEQLLAAGYRPTVWRNVAPPSFLNRGRAVLRVFDPLDVHSPELSPRQGMPSDVHAYPFEKGWQLQQLTLAMPVLLYSSNCRRLLFVARGGAWSSATHRHWPDLFKAAIRTFLLACNRISDGEVMPAEVLLSIVQILAAPLPASS
jgi:hypothetical protein